MSRSGLLMAVLASVAWGTLGAAEEPHGITGEVVDASGRLVDRARIWAVSFSLDEPETLAEASSDDRGTFEFPGFWTRLLPDRKARERSFCTLIARDRAGRLGTTNAAFAGTTTSVKIVLGAARDARSRLRDTSGKPIVGAKLIPERFMRPPAAREGYLYARLPPDLAATFAATTDRDGAFTLSGIPVAADVQARIDAPQYGSPLVYWKPDNGSVVTLDGRIAQVAGSVATTDGKALRGPLSLLIRRTGPIESRAQDSFTLYIAKTVTVGTDGAFRFDALPPGRYEISQPLDPRALYQAESLGDIRVMPSSGVTGLRVNVTTQFAIKGRVIDAVSGSGISGVSLAIGSVSDGAIRSVGQVDTDREGRYEFHAPAGKIDVRVVSVPEAYLSAPFPNEAELNVTADRQWADWKLDRATTLSGIVVDESGAPVKDAEVDVLVPDPSGFPSTRRGVRTSADGTFRLVQLDPEDLVPVRAGTKNATSDGAIVVRPKDQKGTLRIVISPRTSTRLRGVAKDRAGKPVAGARVEVRWGRSYVGRTSGATGIESGREGLITDADGRFVSSAVWPGDRYRVSVQAEGYGSADSTPVTGAVGDHDFGTITLTRIAGHVAGRVVDTAGRPVEGVTVFNRGDAPKAVSVVTGKDGAFRLDGLFTGGRYVFARKEGYRFVAVRAKGDTDKLAVTVRRTDEAPAAWNRETPSADAKKTLAKQVLIALWNRYGEGATKKGAERCVVPMAQLDPALALKWSARLGHRFDDQVRQEAAEAAAETDAEGALDLLQGQTAKPVQYLLQRLAERFAEEDRAKALRFAEEAVVRARGMEQPDRTGALANAGAVLVRLGKREAGRKLIDEAAASAARLGTDSWQAYMRGNAAAALAPFDADRALALIEPMKEANERNRYLGFAGSAVATTDSTRALAIAESMDQNFSSAFVVRLNVAYAIGAERPDDAQGVLEGMKGSMAARYRAEGLAWLAVALAPTDRKRADALIERALAMPTDKERDFASWVSFGGGMGVAASVAVTARRAGYGDMSAAIAWVLASRSTESHFTPEMQTRSLTTAAMLLALTDPGAARQLLRDIESRAGLEPRGLAEVAGNNWYTAWALADPQHAGELIELEFATTENQRAIDLDRTGLLRMTEVLAVPPHRLMEYFSTKRSFLWRPGARD